MPSISNREETPGPEAGPAREAAEAGARDLGAGRQVWLTGGGPDADDVEEGSMESFPASDPPAWMPPTIRMGPPRRDRSP